MAYEKTAWVNGQAPALDAEHLNKIEQGIADAVSVTPQTLSDEQKAQARGNIGAAPGGYGYGETIQRIGHDNITDAEFVELLEAKLSTMDYNSAAQVTWVDHPLISGTTFVGTLWKSGGGEYAVLTGSSYSSLSLIRVKQNNVWQPFEWVNPPMDLGVEYRTTERYLGKPVYVKAVDFGALPNATTKTVTWAASGEVLAVLSVEATGSQGDPVGLGASLSGTELTATKTTLYVKSSGDYSSNTAVFRLKYTKTTD